LVELALENEGYDAVKNGKHAIRVAFQDEIITDAENWMEALKKRNLTSHTYNESVYRYSLVHHSYRDNLM
jgi:hypothetical protein